jgi:hypothetical protein
MVPFAFAAPENFLLTLLMVTLIGNYELVKSLMVDPAVGNFPRVTLY